MLRPNSGGSLNGFKWKLESDHEEELEKGLDCETSDETSSEGVRSRQKATSDGRMLGL